MRLLGLDVEHGKVITGQSSLVKEFASVRTRQKDHMLMVERGHKSFVVVLLTSFMASFICRTLTFSMICLSYS